MLKILAEAFRPPRKKLSRPHANGSLAILNHFFVRNFEDFSMLRSILVGMIAGQRAMTPLAALVGAAQRGTLPYDNGEARLLALPLITAGGVGMGALEMAGDKMKTAPDRTVFLGLLARTISGGFAGATLAPPKRQMAGAALGIGAAIASSYVGLAARKWAMRHWGQTATGFVEDVIMLSAANAIVHAKPRSA